MVVGLATALLGYGLTIDYAKLLGKLANRISGAELPVEPE